MVKGSSCGKRREKEGRFPGNSLCLRRVSCCAGGGWCGEALGVIHSKISTHTHIYVYTHIIYTYIYTMKEPPFAGARKPPPPPTDPYSTKLAHLDPLHLQLLQGLATGQRVGLRKEVGHELVVVAHRLRVYAWMDVHVVSWMRRMD